MKKRIKQKWTTYVRLNTGDGSPRVFLLNSHFWRLIPMNSSQTQYLD